MKILKMKTYLYFFPEVVWHSVWADGKSMKNHQVSKACTRQSMQCEMHGFSGNQKKIIMREMAECDGINLESLHEHKNNSLRTKPLFSLSTCEFSFHLKSLCFNLPLVL